MSTVLPTSADQRVMVANVSWDTFLALVRDAGSPRGRFAYDQGTLEIMSPSGTHEQLKRFIGRIIETLTLRLGIEIRSFGSTTLLREVEQRGLEPDECYYIQSAAEIPGKRDLDMKVDPPPDLVVEVDLSHHSLDKFRIYASLGVPEIWRLKGTELKVYRLGRQGRYAEREASRVLPMLPLEVLRDFVFRSETANETALVREFEAWVKRSVRKI